ncbi:MAG: hypothetical protein U1F20_03310 [Lysobacterales bacterium]
MADQGDAPRTVWGWHAGDYSMGRGIGAIAEMLDLVAAASPRMGAPARELAQRRGVARSGRVARISRIASW